jgi:hypothetical protein
MMSAVAKVIAEIRIELETMEEARKSLSVGITKDALVDIAVSGLNASAKADEIVEKIRKIKRVLEGYQRNAVN